MKPAPDQSGFFDKGNGMQIVPLRDDTRDRFITLPRRKADIEKLNVSRTGDGYLRLGDTTTKGPWTCTGWARRFPPRSCSRSAWQQVFRRTTPPFNDKTREMGVEFTSIASFTTQIVLRCRCFATSSNRWAFCRQGRRGIRAHLHLCRRAWRQFTDLRMLTESLRKRESRYGAGRLRSRSVPGGASGT